MKDAQQNTFPQQTPPAANIPLSCPAVDIKSMSLPELTEQLRSMGEPSYRAVQIFQWMHKGVRTFDEMRNLPRALREKLAQTCFFAPPEIVLKQVSALDGTMKYLWRFADGNCVESVFMRYRHGSTVCISTQAGCRMGCAFCASTLAGKVRNLTPAEMLDQIIFTALDAGESVSNVVLMGIGEPLDNFDAVVKFLELVNAPEGLHLGMRHISLSTCGLVPQIRELAALNLQLTLSVSLHAPDNFTRSRLMPVNRKYPVEELFAACHDWFHQTGRRVSFEYALIDGVNDSDRQAEMTAAQIRGMSAHVNLIALNDVEERALRPSRRLEAFRKKLESLGVNVTLRRRLGRDIDASCGQLRRKILEQPPQNGNIAE